MLPVLETDTVFMRIFTCLRRTVCVALHPNAGEHAWQAYAAIGNVVADGVACAVCHNNRCGVSVRCEAVQPQGYRRYRVTVCGVSAVSVSGSYPLRKDMDI